jgi:hypothetical protein
MIYAPHWTRSDASSSSSRVVQNPPTRNGASMSQGASFFSVFWFTLGRLQNDVLNVCRKISIVYSAGYHVRFHIEWVIMEQVATFALPLKRGHQCPSRYHVPKFVDQLLIL